MAVWLAALLLCLCFPVFVHADQFGLFTYVEYDTFIEITDYPETAIGEVVIPSEIVGKPVTSIGDRAFSSCTSLTRVAIPDSVTSINAAAFRYCTSLTSLTIPDSVTIIGNDAFSNCSSLTGVTIGAIVLIIGDSAFYNCSSLTSVTIPDSVISIEDRAFYSCNSLTSATIGAKVSTIGDLAFDSCNSLLAFQVSESNLFYRSLEGVLFDRPQTTLLRCPEGRTGVYEIPEGVTSIEDRAFYRCTNLTSVTIGNSVTSIGQYAFYECSILTSVTIPDSVTGIDNFTFYGCSSLTSVTIPDSVTGIGSYAFYGCSSLTSVTLGNSVTSIAKLAFGACTSLTSVTIGTKVESIALGAFHSCTNLVAFQVGEDNAFCSSKEGVLFDKPQTTLLRYPEGRAGFYEIPDSVTSIGRSAFSSCTSLTSVTIPDSVTSIGDYSFYSCSSLTSVTIPDSVTSIGSSPFGSCSSLTSVIIGNSVTSIGNSAFDNCSSLLAFQVREGNAFYSSKEGVLLDKSQTSLLRYPEGRAGFYEIPDGVTSIGRSAFGSCTNLTGVTIPDSVTSIGSSAFSGCSSLTSVTIPDSVTSIVQSMFFGCNSLTSIAIPANVRSIRAWAFAECSALNTIYFLGDAPGFPDGVEPSFPGDHEYESFLGSPAAFVYFESAVGFTSPTWQEGHPSRTYGPLSNLSTRGQVLGGDDILIGGLVIGGDVPHTVLIRGIGPGMGVMLDASAVVEDPMISVYSGAEVIASNDDWSDQADPESVAQLAEALGAFPLQEGSKDAALIAVLEPGAYSVHLSGKDGSGIGLVEVYEGSTSRRDRLMNLSTRGRVGTGAALMVPGIVVTDNPRRLLIRGVGPELAVSFGLKPNKVLPNPVVILKDSDGVTIASNDDWGSYSPPQAIATIAQQMGAFPLSDGSADAALLIEVQPGVYTAHVSDANGGEGIALVEVYAAP
ncbi:MAG: leucine-rich repeat domain-containing protein [Opitutaceae bacterium]